LYSVKVPSILAISRFENFPLNLRLEFFEKILPYLSSPKNAEKLSVSLKEYRKIINKSKLDIHELQYKKEFEKKLERDWREIAETTNKFVEDSQMDQINSAIKAGILELYEFKSTDKDAAALNLMIENAAASSAMKVNEKVAGSGQDQAWVSEFVENISNSISDSSTYPLLDDETGNSINADIKTIGASSFEVNRGKQTELARYLLEKLPLFENASVDEIMDIRKELDGPLTRFRTAMIKFSDDIKSTPWGKDFPLEADKVYFRDVKPAMLEIEESIQSNKLLRILFEKMKKPLVLPASSAVSLGIAQFSSLPKELAASLGTGIVTASLVFEAYEEWAKQKRITEQNQLYFYYRAGQRLNK
jgi:hypothetical protein